MKTFRVTFGVNVPAYGSIMVKAKTAAEAERKAMKHHKTGKKTADEWESKIWNESGNLDCQWAEAEDFRLLDTDDLDE